MKKASLVVFIFTTFFVSMLAAQQAKPVLAILDVTTIGTEESKGKIVYNYILDLINKSENYIVVERGELDQALKEIEFSSSDLVDDSTAVEIGKLTGAEAVLISSWTKEEDKFYLSMRVIDIETGEVTRTSVKQTVSFNQVEQITKEAVDYLFGVPAKGRTRKTAGRNNHLAVDTGFSLAFPVNVLREVLGLGYNPVLAISFYLDKAWGSIGFGLATGANITFTNSEAPASYGLYSIPVAFQLSYATNPNSRLLLIAQVRTGAAVNILDYTDATAVEPLASTTFLLASTVGAGMNFSPAIGVYVSGNFTWLFFPNVPYLGIAPGLGLNIKL